MQRFPPSDEIMRQYPYGNSVMEFLKGWDILAIWEKPTHVQDIDSWIRFNDGTVALLAKQEGKYKVLTWGWKTHVFEETLYKKSKEETFRILENSCIKFSSKKALGRTLENNPETNYGEYLWCLARAAGIVKTSGVRAEPTLALRKLKLTYQGLS